MKIKVVVSNASRKCVTACGREIKIDLYDASPCYHSPSLDLFLCFYFCICSPCPCRAHDPGCPRIYHLRFRAYVCPCLFLSPSLCRDLDFVNVNESVNETASSGGDGDDDGETCAAACPYPIYQWD